MILGMTPYTLLHVAISLIGIASGLVVAAGLLTCSALDVWTELFLITTVATRVTGFGFPFAHLLPSHVVGIISLVVLAVTVYARYVGRLAGVWRGIYVVGAMVALFFNVFVLIAQAFTKIPALHVLAPTGSEPPFLFTQVAALAIFTALTVVAVFRFRPPATLAF